MRQGDVMQPLNLLDLFSGIGGFSLGLERSGGFKTAAFCEIEEYPRKVLARHWPEVPCYHDVKELTAERLAADGIRVDAICGGFPCQDLSVAGKGAGIEGERSGLWSEYARLIGEIRPQVVFVENVSAMLARGMGRVLGDLSEHGYDAEWAVIRASDLGAPHRRARLWIVAYPNSEREPQPQKCLEYVRRWIGDCCQEALNSNSNGINAQGEQPCFADKKKRAGQDTRQAGPLCSSNRRQWGAEPGVGRVANGVSARTHRLKGLGNAVVPQIPEILGRAYMEWVESNDAI